ncbi:MAG: hypothetical protein KGL09_00645 [Pseudomonadota bacterium]|jgi:hypothetical protein|nr:hypothetical protein [Pseudomonadota bacterium]
MTGPSTAEMVLLALGALGLNLFLGVLIWTLAFKSGAVDAAAQEIDRAIRAGREASPAEGREAEQRKGNSTTTQDTH